MSFQDDLVADLSRSGVTLAAGAAPSREGLTAGLAKLNAFVGSLDSDTAEVLEKVTSDFPVKAILADPAVNIAPELGSVLTAFDRAHARFSITDVADILKQPLGGDPSPTRPTRPGSPQIDTIQPEQFTLRNSDSNLFVSWSIVEPCDKFHFMWTDKVPTPSFAAGWNAIEFNPQATQTFATRIPKTSIGKVYTFKVQGCKATDVGPDLCGPFCDDRNIQIPGNTHSLRAFLQLSSVPLGAGVRSLGASVFGAGLRAMMRL